MFATETTRFLATSALFEGLTQEVLSEVASNVSRQQYRAGDMIVWQGQPSGSVYVIARGIASVMRLGPTKQASTLAYLMPGQSFGEVGILENQPRSASLLALTDMQVLAFEREDFLRILHRYPSVTIGLARILGSYLVDANRRHLHGANQSRLILLFGLGADLEIDGLGHLLAATLGRNLAQPTSYTVYPDPSRLAAALGADTIQGTYQHAAGYDIVFAPEQGSLPAAVRTTLLIDQLLGQYRNAIIGLPATLDATSMVLLEHAAHVVLVVPPTEAGLWWLRQLRADLTRYTASGRTGISVIAVRGQAEPHDRRVFDESDYELPSLVQFAAPLAADAGGIVPEVVAHVIETLIDRIDRSHQLVLYIPTTIAVDRTFDTSMYVERTLAFLGERFGGATSKQASGVWRSEMAGLVGETVYLVETYATEADLMTHLESVMVFIKDLKHELGQEAMALEVDQKLLLI
jgi:CRP-like cAMP-binding protein